MKAAKDVEDWLNKLRQISLVELRIWRERYPHAARFVQEEAAAEVEGRLPNYPPSTCIGNKRAAS
jgi:hypothetical protein